MAGKQTNERCKACASINIRKLKDKPACYEIKHCSRKRSYYRRHETNKRYQREQVAERKGKAEGCALCGTNEQLNVHHIIPIAIGGHNTKANKITVCNKCHNIISLYYKAIGLMDITIEYGQRAKRI